MLQQVDRLLFPNTFQQLILVNWPIKFIYVRLKLAKFSCEFKTNNSSVNNETNITQVKLMKVFYFIFI